MGYIYLIISLVIIFYMSMRKLDLFSVGSVCFIIYHSHCLYGEVAIQSRETIHIQLYKATIHPTLYYIIFSQLIILFLSMVFYDFYKKPRYAFLNQKEVTKRNDNSNAVHKTFVFIGLLSMILFLFDIFNIGLENLTKHKGVVWENIGIFYIFTLWAALAVFAYAVKNKKHALLFLSLPQVLTHLFIGSRAYFAALVIVFLIFYRDSLKNSVLSNFKTYILGVIGLFAIMVYKKVYTYIKIFDFNSVFNILSDKETYLWVLRLGEPRIVLANYNYIISTQFRFDFSDIFARFISFIPFANRLVEPTHGLHLSKIFINDFNATYGLASNFWAEGYAMFGYAGIFIFFIIWIFILAIGSDMIYSKKWTKYFMIPLICYLAFYIHRLDFVKVIGNIKFLIFACIIWWIINSFITNNWKIIIKRKLSILLLRERPDRN